MLARIAFATLTAFGCSGDGATEGEAEAEAEAEAESEGEDCPAITEVVTFDTDDGITLEADLRVIAGMDVPAVVLLHMAPPANDRTNYPLEFIDALVERGITVLNVDRRGAGGSGGDPMEATLGPGGALDVKAAMDRLAFLDCPPSFGRVGIVGASNGTTTALDYAVLADAESRPAPAALVFLTGGEYTENNNLVDSSRDALEPIPILFEYASNEAVWSSQFVAGAPTTWSFDERDVTPQNGHGTRMFEADPASVDFVADFVADAL